MQDDAKIPIKFIITFDTDINGYQNKYKYSMTL